MSGLVFILFWLLLGESGAEAKMAVTNGRLFENEDALNRYCLAVSYPQIAGIAREADGGHILLIHNGDRLPYSENYPGNYLDSDIRGSFSMPYILEPARPDTPAGYAPGRRRPYKLFKSLYGENSHEVQKSLIKIKVLGKNLRLAPAAARNLAKAAFQLQDLVKQNPSLAQWLKPEGGFYWRNIAGEASLSAHSFGIAVDFSAHKAPYWRWSKLFPHPLQQSYPGEIVKVMEDNGFIWGGKWHEYDMMHYEYRPELICKARIQKLMGK